MMNQKNSNIVKRRHTSPRLPFTSDEDAKLIQIIKSIQITSNSEDMINWTKVSKLMGNRTTRQCKERYLHYLSPKINKNKWTYDEDSKLISEVSRIGKRWKVLENYFNDRTEIDIRNRFYVLQRRISKAARSKYILNKMKLMNNQIDLNQYDDKESFENSKNEIQNVTKFDIKNNSNQNNEVNNVKNDSMHNDQDIDELFEFIFDFNVASFNDDRTYSNNSNDHELFNGCSYEMISINNY